MDLAALIFVIFHCSQEPHLAALRDHPEFVTVADGFGADDGPVAIGRLDVDDALRAAVDRRIPGPKCGESGNNGTAGGIRSSGAGGAVDFIRDYACARERRRRCKATKQGERSAREAGSGTELEMGVSSRSAVWNWASSPRR